MSFWNSLEILNSAVHIIDCPVLTSYPVTDKRYFNSLFLVIITKHFNNPNRHSPQAGQHIHLRTIDSQQFS